MRVILGNLLTFFLIFFLNACTGTYKLNDQSLEKEYFETFYKNNNKVILLSNDIKEFNKNTTDFEVYSYKPLNEVERVNKIILQKIKEQHDL